jgi:Fe-S oxidoreductase
MTGSSELEKFRDALYTCSACSCGFCREDCPMFRGAMKDSAHSRGLTAIMLAFIDGKVKPSAKLAKHLSLCSTCKWCTERCQINVDYFSRPPNLLIDTPKMVELLRTELLEEGYTPPKVKELLLNIRRTHNPWGSPPNQRIEWAKGLTSERVQKTDVSTKVFVCCAYSYDERAREVIKTAATVFEKAGLPFVTLGNEQWCCGDMPQRLGEKELAKLLAEHNIEMLGKDKTHNVISLSPHCYHTMKNDAQYVSTKLTVEHYTQTLARTIDEGTLKMTKQTHRKVAFHDPCYLGRYNGVYDEPRKVLESIQGLKLLEFYRNRKLSFCCGGGSGRVLTEEPPYAERPAEERVKEAVEVGADTIATACPLCLIQLSSATKSLDFEKQIAVKDIVELVSEAL